VRYLIAVVLAGASLSGTQDARTFSGVISDSECGRDGHVSMRMGPTDGECTKACVAAHGGAYVLVTTEEVYGLSDQQTPEAFAGQRVTVRGTLDARSGTIRVDAITTSVALETPEAVTRR